MDADETSFRNRRLIPLWLKIAYTLFAAVLIPFYWRAYGPANFLWFCDVAFILTGIALWLESPLLASMQAVAMLISQTIWTIDFISGGQLLGIAAYMFNPAIPLFTRVLSTFHLWMPVLLLWMVWRLGYDRRAWVWQSVLAIAVLIACYLFTDPAHPPRGYPDAAINVNRVFGPAQKQAQRQVPTLAYLAILIIAYPTILYLPAHLLLRRAMPPSALLHRRSRRHLLSRTEPLRIFL